MKYQTGFIEIPNCMLLIKNQNRETKRGESTPTHKLKNLFQENLDMK